MITWQASMEPPMFDIHMNIPSWPGLIAAIGVLTTRVSALEVTSSPHPADLSKGWCDLPSVTK